MSRCFFVSDLHGRVGRYRKLFRAAAEERPRAVLLGGDLLPFPFDRGWAEDTGKGDFLEDYLLGECLRLAESMGDAFPRFLIILGNDDERSNEEVLRRGEEKGAWEYIHARQVELDGHSIFGYAYVPPTPFQLKDWERYDVSRYVDPGCVSPEEGRLTVPVEADELRYSTIAADLGRLAGAEDLGSSVLLFHSPPYQTSLDRAALDGKKVDHAPVDVHIGSIAIQRFLEERQPLLSLHGHVHESARLTGTWRARIGRTHAFTAAHDGPELALVRFDTEDLEAATRELL